MKKFIFTVLATIYTASALADQPKEWQLGFQNPASDGMRDIVNFHNNILLPVIIGPEGDFSEEEREEILRFKDVQPIKINENILRSETAVISALSIVNYAIN